MYDHTLAAFHKAPLALLPEKLAEIRAFLWAKARGEEIPPERIRAAVQARRQSSGATMSGRVAVVPVWGVLMQRVSLLEESSGGISTEALGRTIDGLVADRSVSTIVLDFDSPGGGVNGTLELADKIRAARDEKQIIGVADSCAASAAYWLLAQCSEVNVTPGGQVGSIGVLTAHEDLSGYFEQAGVKTTLIASTPQKVEGNPYEPLTADALADIQSKVDYYFGAFVAAVAKGRGVSQSKVKSDFGEGRMMLAGDAVRRGMADKVATLEQVLARLTIAPSASGPASARVLAPRRHGDGASLTSSPAAIRARARAVEVTENE